jgi:hypothetical protein
MQRLEVGGAVRPLKWPLGVKWLRSTLSVENEVYVSSLEFKNIIK